MQERKLVGKRLKFLSNPELNLEEQKEELEQQEGDISNQIMGDLQDLNYQFNSELPEEQFIQMVNKIFEYMKKYNCTQTFIKISQGSQKNLVLMGNQDEFTQITNTYCKFHSDINYALESYMNNQFGDILNEYLYNQDNGLNGIVYQFNIHTNNLDEVILDEEIERFTKLLQYMQYIKENEISDKMNGPQIKIVFDTCLIKDRKINFQTIYQKFYVKMVQKLSEVTKLSIDYVRNRFQKLITRNHVSFFDYKNQSQKQQETIITDILNYVSKSSSFSFSPDPTSHSMLNEGQASLYETKSLIIQYNDELIQFCKTEYEESSSQMTMVVCRKVNNEWKQIQAGIDQLLIMKDEKRFELQRAPVEIVRFFNEKTEQFQKNSHEKLKKEIEKYDKEFAQAQEKKYKEFQKDVQPMKVKIKEKLQYNPYFCDFDVVICCDTTGSMDYYCVEVKKKIQELVKLINEYNKEKNQNSKNFALDIKTKFGFVGYKDHCDSEMIELMKLGNESEIQNFISRLQFGGGGDTCEAVFDGLYNAIFNMNWRDNSTFKQIFHLLDAPPHGDEYNDGCYDEYKKGCPCNIRPQDLVRGLDEKRIHYKCIRIGSNTLKSMKNCFQKLFKSYYESDIKQPSEIDIRDFIEDFLKKH